MTAIEGPAAAAGIATLVEIAVAVTLIITIVIEIFIEAVVIDIEIAFRTEFTNQGGGGVE